MNIIPPNYIRDFVLSNFNKVGRIVSAGREMTIPSLFVKNDWKRHMSVNLDTGMWQDFKSGERGDFIALYAITKGITRKLAKAEVYINSFSASQTAEVPKTDDKPQRDAETLTPVSINSCFSDNEEVVRAWEYAYKRKLFNLRTEEPEFFISNLSSMSGRVIIPYFDGKTVFYYQARTLSDQRPKYLNKDDCKVQKSSILYPFDMSLPYVVVCEGPIDAISLKNAGINATCTCGSIVSMEQMKQLKDFGGKVIFGYDNDAAGQKGLKDADKKRRFLLMNEIYFCCPPKGAKDWNDVFVRELADLPKYIEEYSRKYSFGAEFLWDL
jgi:hypothetical protein